MKKFKIACLLLAGGGMLAMAGGLCACDENLESQLPDGDGSSTLVTDKAPNELSAEDAVYAFLQKQTELSSYKITAEGSAVASLAGYKQDIHNITFKNGEDYLNQAESDSVLVKMKHQSFSKGGKVVYRDSFDGEMKVADKDEYKKIYGFTADDVTLGGYIVNPKTLRYANLEKTEGDTFTYYLRLAGDQSVLNGSAVESATAFTRLQAKAYGSLENLPAFSDVDLRLTVKKDWTPVSYSSYCTYDCKKIFNMSVEQTLSCTYSDVNGTVEIPDVVGFNAKLGSTPSKVEPTHSQEEPFVELLSALGNSLGDKGALEVPVSLAVTPFSFETQGALKLRLTRDALERGDFLDALSLRFDLDLSPVPLLGSFCNFLTVRYPGDGLLLLQFGSGAGEQSKSLSTYTLDLADTLPAVSKDMFDLQTLKTVFEANFTLEKTDSGFAVSLKEDLLKKLNDGLGGVVSSLEEKLGDTHGYIRSLLQATFTSAQLDLAGGETIQAVGCTLDGDPAENVTKGEKIGVSLGTKLIGGAIAQPFTGDLDIRLNPAAIWTGDFYAAVKAHLNLDLTPAEKLLQMFGSLGSMMPDIPSWLNANLNNLDVYYTGDGILTIAFNNAAEQPVFMTDIDLKQYFLPAATAPDGEAVGTQGMQGLKLPQIIFEIKENGFEISLGENLVQELNSAYQALVQTAVDYVTEAAGSPLGAMAGQMIKGWIDAKITHAGIFVGRNDDGKVMFSLSINGCPTSDPSHDYSERSLLTLTLTHLGALNADEQKALLDVGEKVKELHEMSEKAAEYDAQVQKFIDEMDVSEAGYDKYVKDVAALQDKIASEKDGMKSLMATKSYLETKTYKDKEYTVLLLTAELYHERVGQFKEKLAQIEVPDDETKWDELNALYDKSAASSGITVPAIGENDILKAAIGEETLASYIEKRNAHEDAIVQTLISQIEESKATYQNATDRGQLTAALTEIVTTFKPVYDKLPAAKQANVTGYSEYVKDIYLKNIDGVTKEYQAVKAALDALSAQDEAVTIDEILEVMKQLSEAYAWGYGYDYWETNTIEKVQTWGTTWITSLKPADLSADEQTKISDLNTLNRSFMKGEIATKILGKYTELIIKEVSDLYEKISTCRIVGDDGKDTWDFDGLDGDKSAVLEKIHGIRFLICKVLPAAIINIINDEIGKDDPELKQFARIDLTKYEKALAEHLKSTSGD